MDLKLSNTMGEIFWRSEPAPLLYEGLLPSHEAVSHDAVWGWGSSRMCSRVDCHLFPQSVLIDLPNEQMQANCTGSALSL